jgi:hypothetical protein
MSKILRFTSRPAPLPSEATKKDPDDDSETIPPDGPISIRACPEAGVPLTW